MLTNDDIKAIITAGQSTFATKEELTAFREEMRDEFAKLQTSVDAYAKRADSFFEELVMTKHRMDRHEKWLHQLAEKLDVKLEY